MKKAAVKLQAATRGHQVRQQVQIASQSHGVVSTTIRAPRHPLSLSVAPGTFVSDIQQHLQTAATFTRVSVSGGTLDIHGTRDDEGVRAPQELAQSAAPGAAVINGGYFVHKAGLQTGCGETIDSLGCPVGQVAGRRDFIPVPGPWGSDYATITANDEPILSSAPLLALDGRSRPIEDADRFR
ncbi:IQ calmodulin-binding motif-containing protein [Xanthomonas translucens pv. graminis]|uniref:IQ calmodulin-binding motif-containing protein n=1 Tax=Xanthomonas graminis TaxID=3390026 RepID=UPI0025407A6E|nr:IQ calmodulin-binding motif-containing protein [Xanthomonas translucens]WIH03338.1 IQ calmodulin-binding motif-containing protein [Xanthomonas translucens pv. graminis]